MKKGHASVRIENVFLPDAMSVTGRRLLGFLPTNECKTEVKLDEDCIVSTHGGVPGTFVPGRLSFCYFHLSKPKE